MESLFSPWRSRYIESFKKPAESAECIFCKASNDENAELVVWRSQLSFVVMNLYPYNSGHMMIVPKRHTADFLSLAADELLDAMELLQTAQRALSELSAPHGYNIGINLGRTAGAGIENHLHWHIVPRWNGDTNFMPTLADVKVVSEDIPKQCGELRKLFTKFLA